MDNLLDFIGPARELDGTQIITSLILSFILSSFMAAIYKWTHSGFSYSRSFVQTLILGCLCSAIMIIAIGNNLAKGLGIMGALAIVRFRSPIRDPRDLIFLFACLALGIACGSQSFQVAIYGSIGFAMIAFYLHAAPFSSRREFEGLLRFVLPPQSNSDKQVHELFAQYTSSAELVAMREAVQGDAIEYSYQLRLLDPSYKADLLKAITKVPDLSEVSLIMQRSTVEI